MLRTVISRILTTIPLLLVVSILAFLVVQSIPGSIAEEILGEGVSDEDVEALEAELGLDAPLPVQYLRWLGNALTGDLGISLNNNVPVTTLLNEAYPVTLSITIGGMIVGVILGLSFGILAGLSPGSFTDRFVTFLASTTVAIPGFVLAMLLAIFLALRLGWFPVIGFTPPSEGIVDWLLSITLPSIALGIPSSALIARQTRSAMSNVLQSSYIRAARAMGVPRGQIVREYALKNAMIPVLTVIGFRLAVVIGQSFVVEQVFSMRGIGSMMVEAIRQQNVYVVQAVIVIVAVFVVGANLLIDIGYTWLNPKVRLG
ncbi:MAG: ABC transporter permease [Chloroflexota bacterium]